MGSQYEMASEYTMVEEEVETSEYTMVEGSKYTMVEEEVEVTEYQEETVLDETQSGYDSKFMSSNGFSTMGDDLEFMNEVNQQTDLEHYGPSINHAFRHEEGLIAVKPKNV